MDNELLEVRDNLKRITLDNRSSLLSGMVISVNEGTMTAIVALTEDVTDDTGTATNDKEINLNVLLNNTLGVYMVPAIGANCLVAEVDGPGMWELLKADSYSKITGTVGNNMVVVDGDGITIKAGSSSVGVTDGNIKNVANSFGVKASDISIGSTDSPANHVMQFEGFNAALTEWATAINYQIGGIGGLPQAFDWSPGMGRVKID